MMHINPNAVLALVAEQQEVIMALRQENQRLEQQLVPRSERDPETPSEPK